MKKFFFLTALLLAGAALLSGCSVNSGHYSPKSTTAASTGSAIASESDVSASGQTLPGQTTQDSRLAWSTWSLASSVPISVGGSYLSVTASEIYRDEPSCVNYLTGETLSEEDTTLGISRPTGVCVMNTEDAVSLQRGLSRADVIWEVQAGSEASRLMAFYYNPTAISAIGPVAAASPCFVSIAEGYDAYLLYNGVVSNVNTLLTEQQSDDINAAAENGTSCFFTDTDIAAASGYDLSVFTSSGRIAKSILALAAQGAHTIVDSPYLTPFSFSQSFFKPIGGTASRVHLDYGGFQPYFLYDSTAGVYRRYEHGAPHVDSETGEVLSFENVIVLICSGSAAEVWKLSGSGTGIYASGGRYQSITWSKASMESPVQFYNASGTALTINRGHTFISVVAANASLSVS